MLITGECAHHVLLPRVTDISAREAIRLELELTEEGIAEVEVTLCPLRIARPEFFPEIKGSAAVAGKGAHTLDIPFAHFAFRQMTGAFLNYLDSFSVRLQAGAPVLLKSVSAVSPGILGVRAEIGSKAGEAGEQIKYQLLLTNRSGREIIVNIRQSLYGKECLSVEYTPYVILGPHESREYMVNVGMTGDIPPGGLEKSTFLFVPEGDAAQTKQIVLQTVRKREHPYLFLKEEQWKRRKAALAVDEKLCRAFYGKYVETADAWEVPETAETRDHVYPAYSQNDLFRTAVAWKITGKKIYLQKVLEYLTRLTDTREGYLATRQSYFTFIGSREEYARGDFKVCRAQSAGWVQEAEFFNRVAMTYDLVYEHCSPKIHLQMEECLRNYMRFVSWRLTDGDGNNFQVAESGAGLLCAMVLQDQEMVNRFLYGYNGFTDLLSAVLLDDGTYFEQASGYVRLAGELFFDIANGAENFGISIKDVRVPASFDRNILHAPWAMRETWAEDGKPFLGMSFRHFEAFTTTSRCLKDFYDCTAELLTDKGIMMSINDSNEQDFTELYQKAYYLYGDPLYRQIAGFSFRPETLLVPEHASAPGAAQSKLEKTPSDAQDTTCSRLGKTSRLLPAAGFGILRDGSGQAVLKFGLHGGYHGHYDRLSLASFIRDGQTFHNNEYAWFGYDSFLFKMWVQTSMAHNMTVVDCRMQKPSPCQCIYYAVEKEFSAVCAQTVTEWIDPPYGGQTPYPFSFPDEKCEREGRFILRPKEIRRQGEIGDASEPIFQRRLLILFHGYCVIWDYLEGCEKHRYDCLYHPMGRLEDGGEFVWKERERFSDDPFGAGQFIQNCRTARVEGTVCLRFHDGQPRGRAGDVMDHMPETAVWRAWPVSGEATVGKYPQNGDTFTKENRKAAAGYLAEPGKKTISFTVEGEKAEFITLLEAGGQTGKIRVVSCRDYHSIVVTEDSGERWKISVEGIDKINSPVRTEIHALPFVDGGTSGTHWASFRSPF